MKHWLHPMPTLSPDEIADAVKDQNWQEFRKSLKGCSTEEKLESLNQYLCNNASRIGHRARVQVTNYINALKRGGQLDTEGRVVR